MFISKFLSTMKNILLQVALVFCWQLAVWVPVFIWITEIFKHGSLYCELSSVVTHWALSFMTLGTFRGAFQSASDMASRRDHAMESMPAPSDCHSCVFLYKNKAVGELPACWFGGAGRRCFISIWDFSAEYVTKGLRVFVDWTLELLGRV